MFQKVNGFITQILTFSSLHLIGTTTTMVKRLSPAYLHTYFFIFISCNGNQITLPIN